MPDPDTESQDHLLSNKTYDVLKKVALIYLPAFGTLYFTLAGFWGLPAAEEVSGTVLAVDTFMGVVLGFSSKTYNNSDAKYDGEIHVQQNPLSGQKTASMELVKDVNDKLDRGEPILFKVNPATPVDPELDQPNNQDDMMGED